MDALMKSILTTVANSTDAVKPGVAECVRQRIEEEDEEEDRCGNTPETGACFYCKMD